MLKCSGEHFSKDHRPDLKQLLLTLTVTHDGAIPVHLDVSSGNTSDSTTHIKTWNLLCELTGRTDFLYIGDSKLASNKTMRYIDGLQGRFISVLPRTRREDQDFRNLLRDQDLTWTDLYSRHDDENEEVVVDTVSVCDHPCVSREGFRIYWYHSTRKQDLDARARANRIEKTTQALADLSTRLSSPRTRYRERSKVHEAATKIVADNRTPGLIAVHVLEFHQDTFRQKKPGRPGKNTQYRRETRKRFGIDYELKPDGIAEEAVTDGMFPLITNDSIMTAEEVVLAYKDQPRVEKRFKNLKTDFCVRPVFLKKVERVQALLCTYFFALLIQSLLEREVRTAMDSQDVEALSLYHEAKPCRTPTTRKIIDAFADIQRHEVSGSKKIDGGIAVTELNPLQSKILRLLGISQRQYFDTRRGS